MDEDGEPDGCYFVDENGVPFIWRDIYQPPVYRLLNINADTYLRSGTYENDDNSASSELTIWERDDSSNDSNLLIYHIGGLPPSQEITTPLWLYIYGGSDYDCGTQSVAVITKPGELFSRYTDIKSVREGSYKWTDGETGYDEWGYYSISSSYRFLRMADLTFGRDGSNAWAKVCLTNCETDEEGKVTVILDPETTEPALYDGFSPEWGIVTKVVSIESSDTSHRPYVTTTPPEQTTRSNFWDNTALSAGCVHLFDFENPDRERWSYVRGDTSGIYPAFTYINNLANSSYPMTACLRYEPYNIREIGEGPNGGGCRGMMANASIFDNNISSGDFPFGASFTMVSLTRVDGCFVPDYVSLDWSIGYDIAGVFLGASSYGGSETGYSWWIGSDGSSHSPNKVTSLDIRGKWVAVSIEQNVTSVKIRLVIDGTVYTHTGTISAASDRISMPNVSTSNGYRSGALRHGPLYVFDRANLSDADLITLWGGGYGMDNNLT